ALERLAREVQHWEVSPRDVLDAKLGRPVLIDIHAFVYVAETVVTESSAPEQCGSESEVIRHPDHCSGRVLILVHVRRRARRYAPAVGAGIVTASEVSIEHRTDSVAL